MFRIFRPNILKPLNKIYTIRTTTQSKAKLFSSNCSNEMSTTHQNQLKFKEIDGDLFSAPKTYSLAHCVASDFVMGAGIAVKFKQVYNHVDSLLKQNVGTGGVAVLKVDNNQRYIYYLVTKAYSYEKPTYNSLKSSLHAMRKHMIANDVKFLALPRIGCGIDGLEWDTYASQQIHMGTDKQFIFKELTGDLFSAPTNYALGHCVAEDLKMGKGIAVKFRNSFGKLDQLKAQSKTVGDVAVLKHHDQRYIYYLITKKSSWGKPTYASLSASLHAMRAHMIQNDVHYLALPKIGCGLDGLNWDKVKELLHDAFKNDDIEITVYHYS